MSRLDNLMDRATRYGLQIDTWSPGDGKKRFRFLTADTGHKRGFVLTITNAENWLDAYVLGYEAGLHHGQGKSARWLEELIDSAAYGKEL